MQPVDSAVSPFIIVYIVPHPSEKRKEVTPMEERTWKRAYKGDHGRLQRCAGGSGGGLWHDPAARLRLHPAGSGDGPG